MTINFNYLVDEFGLGVYVKHDAMADGNAEAYKLVTSTGSYFLKQVEDIQAIELYGEVERKLNDEGVRQARLFQKLGNGCVSDTGFAVYEFLNGDASHEMKDERLESLMAYMGRFHEALRQVAVPATVTDNSNPWKKADSLDYILGAFERGIVDLKVSDSTRSIIRDTLDFLRDEREGLEKLSIQLIHGDVGPGNILYAGDSVISVIDFTPMSGTGLYALCHFFYWQFLSFDGGRLAHRCIERALSLYMNTTLVEKPERELFHTLFVKAAAFRLFGALISISVSPGSYPIDRIEKRAALLRLVLYDEALRGFVGEGYVGRMLPN